MQRRDAAGRLEVNAAVKKTPQIRASPDVTFQLVDGEGQRLAVGRRFHGVQVNVQAGDVIIVVFLR